MRSVEELRTDLEQISVIDDHAVLLEQVINELEDQREAALVDDVLRMFERCRGQDDYGMFSSLQCWIDKLPRSPELDAVVQASLLRGAPWKVVEMIGGYTSSPAQAADLLEQVLREGTFRDEQYSASWLQKRIDELRAR